MTIVGTAPGTTTLAIPNSNGGLSARKLVAIRDRQGKAALNLNEKWPRLTGDVWRWPDIIKKWNHPRTKLILSLTPNGLKRLCLRAGVHDADLQAAVAAGYDRGLATAEGNWLMANLIDAAASEQAQRYGLIKPPRPELQLDAPIIWLSLSTEILLNDWINTPMYGTFTLDRRCRLPLPPVAHNRFRGAVSDSRTCTSRSPDRRRSPA